MARSAPNANGGRFGLEHGMSAFDAVAESWDDFAARQPSPFLTHAWLKAWWTAFGDGEPVLATIRGEDGALRAGALLRRTRTGGLAAAANDHSGDWDAVAADDDAHTALWAGLAGSEARSLVLGPLRPGGHGLLAARRELEDAGLRVLAEPGARSPWLALPRSYDELTAGLSRNLRSQVGRRRRALEKEGELVFRTTTNGERLEADLDAFLAVEASGWKADAGTAVLREPGAETLYRTFARAAAERGWLRLHLLELDGAVLAADLGIVVGDQAFLVKTGFDESWSRLSPGLVLRADVLRASIEEGVAGYDFLGPDDAYKLRWTSTVRPRVTLRAYRGAVALPAGVWRRYGRPAVKRLRDRVDAARR